MNDGYFYLLYKVHKVFSPDKPVPTRPVCLDCASITNPIGTWADIKLQPLAKAMKNLKDSFEFKKMIDNLGRLNHRSKLFTYDANSIYTNIPTDFTLEAIIKYLTVNKSNFNYHRAPALISAEAYSNSLLYLL